MDDTGRPQLLKHKQYFDPDQEPYENERDAYAPLVWQCRYGGIEVPDHLWQYALFGKDKKYSESQAEHMVHDDKVMHQFDKWVSNFTDFVKKKGKVEPGKYRAYGFNPPSHFINEMKLGWKYFRMMIGKPVRNSSPWYQQKEGINKDATFQPRKGEGQKIR